MADPMTSDIAELIERLEATPPGRHGADDCWQAAAALQAQQAEITQLKNDVDLHRGRWQRLVNAWASAFNRGHVYGDDTEAVAGTIEAIERAALAQKEPAE